MITEANAFKVQENFKDSSLEEAIKMLSEIKKQIGIQEIFEEVFFLILNFLVRFFILAKER